LQGVFEEESYPYDFLKNYEQRKLFFKNQDDHYLKTLQDSSFTISIGKTGRDYSFNFLNDAVELHGENAYRLENKYITGEHNFFNLASSFLMATKVYPKKEIEFVAAATSFKPTANRSEWIEIGSNKIFLDAYNANPSSMIAALSGFKNRVDAKSLVVIGQMFELGEMAVELHQEIAEFVSKQHFDQVVFIGELGQAFKQKCSNALTYRSANDFKEDFIAKRESYDYIFIKGSRSLQLESLLDIT
jgi:UDP-N-acetylmuramoyl-tripeptide--D-alanyl-D-alanine ligase